MVLVSLNFWWQSCAIICLIRICLKLNVKDVKPVHARLLICLYSIAQLENIFLWKILLCIEIFQQTSHLVLFPAQSQKWLVSEAWKESSSYYRKIKSLSDFFIAIKALLWKESTLMKQLQICTAISNEFKQLVLQLGLKEVNASVPQDFYFFSPYHWLVPTHYWKDRDRVRTVWGRGLERAAKEERPVYSVTLHSQVSPLDQRSLVCRSISIVQFLPSVSHQQGPHSLGYFPLIGMSGTNYTIF